MKKEATGVKGTAALRWGISTGTCAAAAAKAAAMAAIGVNPPASLAVALPSGEDVELAVLQLAGGRFGVVKDAGDDLDATDGVTVTATVTLGEGDGPISFVAGEGVGTVTLPGLKIPPGEPAINPVPREMIERAVRTVVGERAAAVEIAIPGGRELAERTFNRRLGIEGGLSILGTTGRVRPMDENSLYESLTLELSTHAARGHRCVFLTFAATGEKAARSAWGLPEGVTVQVANEIGFALDECVRLGIGRVILAGHPGKLLKVAAGGFDTHNRVCDGRFEALCTHIAIISGSCAALPEIYACTTTEAALAVMREKLDGGTRAAIWHSLAERAASRCQDRVFGDLEVAAAFLENDGGVLGQSASLLQVIEELKRA